MTAVKKLIVLSAFDRDDEGNLQPAFPPREMRGEDSARRAAKEMATRHVGVIAWSRDADPLLGDYGPSVELFVNGDIPDLE